jgi:hypothetical protein
MMILEDKEEYEKAAIILKKINNIISKMGFTKFVEIGRVA